MAPSSTLLPCSFANIPPIPFPPTSSSSFFLIFLIVFLPLSFPPLPLIPMVLFNFLLLFFPLFPLFLFLVPCPCLCVSVCLLSSSLFHSSVAQNNELDWKDK